MHASYGRASSTNCIYNNNLSVQHKRDKVMSALMKNHNNTKIVDANTQHTHTHTHHTNIYVVWVKDLFPRICAACLMQGIPFAYAHFNYAVIVCWRRNGCNHCVFVVHLCRLRLRVRNGFFCCVFCVSLGGPQTVGNVPMEAFFHRMPHTDTICYSSHISTTINIFFSFNERVVWKPKTHRMQQIHLTPFLLLTVLSSCAHLLL